MERKDCWKTKESDRYDNRKYYVNTDSNISQWGISSPDLPFGWEMFTSRKDSNIKYYYNKYNDIAKIEKPTQRDAVTLPDGWTAKNTEKCNAIFYVNESENKSQWEYPEAYPKRRETRSGPPRSYHDENESESDSSLKNKLNTFDAIFKSPERSPSSYNSDTTKYIRSASPRSYAGTLSSKQGSPRSTMGSLTSGSSKEGSLRSKDHSYDGDTSKSPISESSKQGSEKYYDSSYGDRSRSPSTRRSYNSSNDTSVSSSSFDSSPSKQGSPRPYGGSLTSGSSSSLRSALSKQGSPRPYGGSLASGSSSSFRSALSDHYQSAPEEDEEDEDEDLLKSFNTIINKSPLERLDEYKGEDEDEKNYRQMLSNMQGNDPEEVDYDYM